MDLIDTAAVTRVLDDANGTHRALLSRYDQLHSDYAELLVKYQTLLPKVQTVWALDMTKIPLGQVRSAAWKAASGMTQQDSQIANLSGVDLPTGRALRIRFPKLDTAGVAVTILFPDRVGRTDATITSTFSHRAPFDWKLGGKHAGLGACVPESRVDAAGGGNYQGDLAAGCRPMWKQNGAGELYAYGPDQRKQPANGFTQGVCYGDGIPIADRATIYTAGKVQTESMRCVLDGLDTATVGRIVYTLDGTQLADVPWKWREREDCLIRGVQFAWFPGGSGDAWETPGDRFVDVLGCKVTAPI